MHTNLVDHVQYPAIFIDEWSRWVCGGWDGRGRWREGMVTLPPLPPSPSNACSDTQMGLAGWVRKDALTLSDLWYMLKLSVLRLLILITDVSCVYLLKSLVFRA